VPILTVRDVTKSYANVRAVAGVSFAVRKGEIFALLGPNGAGKTSLVRMLLGILTPDSGDIEYRLLGDSPTWPNASLLGYLPEERGLYKDIPILRTLIYFGVLRGMRRKDARAAAEEWLESMGLADRANVKLDALSKGNQQKVQFISAVLHRPSFAVLDEPFSGLDPLNQEFFARLIRMLRDEGMTILLSAHQMQLVEKLADRVLLMNHGREVLSGTVDELRKKTRATTRLGIHVRGKADPAVFDGHPAVVGVETNGNGTMVLMLRDGALLSDLLVHAGTRLDVIEVHTERLTLHDIYVEALGGANPAPSSVVGEEGEE
jgi:ABC-2 type transport system ATP-binding protein